MLKNAKLLFSGVWLNEEFFFINCQFTSSFPYIMISLIKNKLKKKERIKKVEVDDLVNEIRVIEKVVKTISLIISMKKKSYKFACID